MYGKEPYKDVPIEFVGLRPGEKIKEELGKLVEKKRELELRLAEAGEKAKEQAMEQMPQEMQFSSVRGFTPVPRFLFL